MILMVILGYISFLRFSGSEKLEEWRNQRNGIALTPTPVVHPETTITPEPTETLPEPTPKGLVAFASGEERWISEEEVSALEFTGIEAIDADIREQLSLFIEDRSKVCYREYWVENYVSAVFCRTIYSEGEPVELLLPLVYDSDAGKRITGSGLIKDTYFAVIKERLQSVVAELFPEGNTDGFLLYEQAYRTEDYEKFYMTEETLVFYFDEESLFMGGHRPFTYEVPLKEAKAFFYKNLDGTLHGHGIRELDPEAKMVALTYDDGPSFTSLDIRLTELLERYDAKATFFFVGNRLTAPYESEVAAVYEAGHEVASHTYSHLNLEAASAKEMWQEINKTNLRIAEITGYAPDYIRLPGGTKGPYVEWLPMPIIKWDVDSVDYKNRGEENGETIIFERLKGKNITDGSIILMHSIYGESYEASELLIPWLKEQGYEFVTLTELFYYKGVKPENGAEYSSFSDDGGI